MSIFECSLQKGFAIKHMDETSAFLNGVLKDEVYMEPPEGLQVEHGHVCKLERALYGLKTAPLLWNNVFDGIMKELGFSRSINDGCLYMKNINGREVYVLLYVDDLLLASGSEHEIVKLSDVLSERLEMKDLGLPKKFVGFELEWKENELILSQENYTLTILKRFGMQDSKPVSMPLEANFKINEAEIKNESNVNVKKNEKIYPIRELVGSLLYLAGGTRPDLTHAVNVMSRYQDFQHENIWKALKRILRYLCGTVTYKLKYLKCGGSTNVNDSYLSGFVDADFASENDRKSVSGFVFYMCNNVVSWSTRKQMDLFGKL